MGTPGRPRPFAVHVPDGIPTDLRERLARTRWPDEAPGAGWRLEAPDLLADDIRAFFRPIRG